MKTEIWNGYKIRFVEVSGEWCAVAKDIANALGYKTTPHMMRNISSKDKGIHKVDTLGGKQKVSIVSEFGVYDAIFSSSKKEAKQFKRWIFDVIKELRKDSSLEGFEIFRMLDKDHQKKTMNQLCQSLKKPVRIDFIKANIVTDKAVSNKFGHKKMIKKGEMTPNMLVEREPILEDVVNLMAIKDKYNLNLSVSKTIYDSIG